MEEEHKKPLLKKNYMYQKTEEEDIIHGSSSDDDFIKEQQQQEVPFVLNKWTGKKHKNYQHGKFGWRVAKMALMSAAVIGLLVVMKKGCCSGKHDSSFDDIRSIFERDDDKQNQQPQSIDRTYPPWRPWPPGRYPFPDSVCNTKSCVLAAANILENIDESIDPCDDFYSFSCKNWEAKRDIPDHKSRIAVFDALSDENSRVIRMALEKPVPTPLETHDNSTATFIKLQNVYKSCMNTTHIDEAGTAPLAPLLHAMDKIFPIDHPKSQGTLSEDDRKRLELALVHLQFLGIDSIFGIGIQADAKSPDVQTIYLSQPSLGLPSIEYYKEEKFLDVYKSTIVKMFTIFGKNATQNLPLDKRHSDWTSVAQKLVDFEAKLANISWSNEKLSDPIAVYNPYSFQNLTSLIPYLNIQEILQELTTFASDTDLKDLKAPIVVMTPSYFTDLEAIVNETDVETLNAYFRWNIIFGLVDTLGEDVRAGMAEFKEKVRGISPKSLPPRHETCLSYVDKIMGFAAGKVFADVKFPGNSKAVAKKMTDIIINTFVARISSLDWLDATTLSGAIDKMKKLIRKIGFPDFINDPDKLWEYYSDLTVCPVDFFGNVLRYSQRRLKREWKKVGRPTDYSEWEMFPQTVNAYYNPFVNEIAFPAGILQSPFFDADVPSYLNYGGIGLVQGHEVSHGIDNMGRHFDAQGRLVDWWTPETDAKFNEKSKCFIDQYEKYFIVDGEGRKVNVNGKLTLGENLADNGGLRQAWTAWGNSSSEELASNNAADHDHRRPSRPQFWQKLPGLKYAPNQLFFVNFAQVWCSKRRPEYSLQAIRTDPHSPPFVRVNAAVSNSLEFANAFKCPVGANMNPAKKCSIW